MSSVVQHWGFRATAAKLAAQDFVALTELGFLCRSAYADADSRRLFSHLKHVHVGDVFHVHYRGKDGPRAVGAFRVCHRDGHPLRDCTLAAAVEGAPALYQLSDVAFLERLDAKAAYTADPRLGRYTGWLVRPAACSVLGYDFIHFDRDGETVGTIAAEEWPTSIT